MSTEKQLFNVREFAGSLGVTESCVRKWVSEQKVSVVKLGRLVRIPREEQHRLIKNGMRPAIGGEHNGETTS